MAYSASYPADDLFISDIPAAIRLKGEQLKNGRIVDAGYLAGAAAGNSSGNIPISNGTVCTNLNADKLDGHDSTYFSVSSHVHSVATTGANGFMSNTDKVKLNSIATGAEVNQNAFSNIVVGATTIQADSKTDTLNLTAGSGIVLTPNASTDSVTITLGAHVHDVATGSSSGFMSAAHYNTINSLASMAYQASDSVNITGGSIEGVAMPEIQALNAKYNFQFCYDCSTSFESASHKWIKVLSGSASITPNSPGTGELTIIDSASGQAGYYKSNLNFQPNDSFILMTRVKKTTAGLQFIFRLTENDSGANYKHMHLYFSGANVIFCDQTITLDISVYHDYTVIKDKQNFVYLFVDGVLKSKIAYNALTGSSVAYATTFSFIGLGYPSSSAGSGTLVCDYYKYSILKEGVNELNVTLANIINGSLNIKNQAETEGIQISSNTISTTGTNQDIKLAPNGTGNILPDTDNDISLGNYSYRFRDGFFSNSLVSANSFIKAASGVSGYVYFYENEIAKGRLIYESSATRFMIQNLTDANTYLALYNNGSARLNAGSNNLILSAGTGIIQPSSSNTHDLGSSSYKWKEAYISNFRFTTNEIINTAAGGSVTLTPGSGAEVYTKSNLAPYTNNTYYLGSSSCKWAGAYLGEAYINGQILTMTNDLLVYNGSNVNFRLGAKTSETNKPSILEFCGNANASNAMTYGFNFWYDASDTNEFRLYRHENSTTGNRVMSIVRSSGYTTFHNDVNITGSLSKGSGSFLIDHPILEDAKLYHGFVEAPRHDLIYRGVTELNENGQAVVCIDQYSNMTIGTFEALTQNAQIVSLLNLSGGQTPKATKIKGGLFRLEGEQGSKISWLVMAERADKHIKGLYNSDKKGSLIPEIKKETYKRYIQSNRKVA